MVAIDVDLKKQKIIKSKSEGIHYLDPLLGFSPFPFLSPTSPSLFDYRGFFLPPGNFRRDHCGPGIGMILSSPPVLRRAGLDALCPAGRLLRHCPLFETLRRGEES